MIVCALDERRTAFAGAGDFRFGDVNGRCENESTLCDGGSDADGTHPHRRKPLRERRAGKAVPRLVDRDVFFLCAAFMRRNDRLLMQQECRGVVMSKLKHSAAHHVEEERNNNPRMCEERLHGVYTIYAAGGRDTTGTSAPPMLPSHSENRFIRCHGMHPASRSSLSSHLQENDAWLIRCLIKQ